MAKVAGWLAAAALAACAFGACGGDDDASSGPTTAAVSPQATQSAPTAAATSAPTPDATAGPTLAPEQAALAAGLPRASELGDGWEELSRGPTTPTEDSLCGEAVNITGSDVVGVYLNNESEQFSLVVGISNAAAEDIIAGVRRALDGCSELSITGGGKTTIYPVEVVDFDAYGDDTLALRVTTQFEGFPEPSVGHFVLIREGDLNLVVADLYLDAADAAQTQTVVAAAYTALQRID